MLCFFLMAGLSGCGMLGLDFSGSRDDKARIKAERKDMPEDFNPDVIDERLSEKTEDESASLFGESLKDDSARITRLENTVERMRSDLDDVLPSIKRLVAIETEIQELVGQLKTLIEQPRSLNLEPQRPQVPADLTAPGSTVMTTPAPSNNTAPVQTSTAAEEKAKKEANVAKTASGLSISEIRVADYPSKIRMVFESSNKLNYDINFDAQENIVYVQTNAKQISLNKSSLMRKSAVIQDINVIDRNGNKDIAIALRKGRLLSKSTTIAPNKDSRAYRHFFDITF